MKGLGWTLLVIGGAVGMALGSVYSLLNPELTQAQVFLDTCHLTAMAVLCLLIGAFLLQVDADA